MYSTHALSALKSGTRVAVAEHGRWNTHSQGFYAVTNANKTRIIIKRESDGYERTFSTRTGLEKGSDRYRSAFIESVEDQQARIDERNHVAKINAAWEEVNSAVNNKDSNAVYAALEKVKQITVGDI